MNAVRRVITTVALLGVALLVLHAAPAMAAGCQGVSLCQDEGAFTAQLADVRTSTAGRFRVVSATLHIVNRRAAPLVLGYVVGSGIVTDDRGNRYTVAVNTATGVRGIGLINASTFDPRFVLQPGESGDVRFEFLWQPGRQIFGTVFGMDLSLREIEPLPGNQFRLAREHLVHFDGLTDRAKSTGLAAPGEGAPPAQDGRASGATPPASSNCGDDPRCTDAGAFTASVQQVTTSTVSTWHLVRFTLRLRNASNAPLILAYVASSGSMTDELGNRYVLDHRVAGRVAGIGVTDRVQADPQFVLRPGEARTITVEYGRRAGHTQIGMSYSPDLVLQQLEVLPSRQIRPTRDFSVSFRELGAGTYAGAAGGTLNRLEQTQQATRQISEGLRQLMKPKP